MYGNIYILLYHKCVWSLHVSGAVLYIHGSSSLGCCACVWVVARVYGLLHDAYMCAGVRDTCVCGLLHDAYMGCCTTAVCVVYMLIDRLLCLLVASGVSASCLPGLVLSVQRAGLISYVYECVSWSTPSEACFASFITDTGLQFGAGECRQSYQDMIDAWYPVIGSCLPGLDTSACIFQLGGGILEFYDSVGIWPFTFCTAAQVQNKAINGVFTTILRGLWATYPLEYLLQTTTCDFCYHIFEQQIVDKAAGLAATGDSALVSACTDLGGPTAPCLESSFVIDARKNFSVCSGRDIFFQGPVCTADSIALIESLIPTPYYTFAQCAYFPSNPFCHTIAAYFKAIETDTGNNTDCLACYTKLNADILILAAADFTHVCLNVFLDDCLAYQNQIFIEFEACSGITLNTRPTLN